MKMNGKFQQLAGSVDHLTQRVGRLAEQLVTETAASRLTRWASQHPPRSDFVRQLAEGNTGRWVKLKFHHIADMFWLLSWHHVHSHLAWTSLSLIG